MELKDLEIVPKNVFTNFGKFVELRKIIKKLIEWGFELSYVNDNHNYFSLLYSKDNFDSIHYKKVITFNISELKQEISYRITTRIWSYTNSETITRTQKEYPPMEFDDTSEYIIVAKDRLVNLINDTGMIF